MNRAVLDAAAAFDDACAVLIAHDDHASRPASIPAIRARLYTKGLATLDSWALDRTAPGSSHAHLAAERARLPALDAWRALCGAMTAQAPILAALGMEVEQFDAPPFREWRVSVASIDEPYRIGNVVRQNPPIGLPECCARLVRAVGRIRPGPRTFLCKNRFRTITVQAATPQDAHDLHALIEGLGWMGSNAKMQALYESFDLHTFAPHA